MSHVQHSSFNYNVDSMIQLDVRTAMLTWNQRWHDRKMGLCTMAVEKQMVGTILF